MNPAPSTFTRRDALKGAASAALGLAFLGSARLQAKEEIAQKGTPAAPKDRTRGIHLGVASFSLGSLPVDRVISVVRQLDIKTVSLYKAHAPWATGTPQECRAVVDKFREAGIAVTSTGVIDLPNDEAVVRKAFENVRGAGLTKMCGRPNPDAFALVDKFVKEFDLRVAIHNHGPGDLYPTAFDAMKAVEPYDRRLGLCIDVGHGWLGGGDPVASIRQCRERLYEVHLKDTRGPQGAIEHDPSPVIVGRGVLDIKGILAALVDIRFAEQVEFEYEEKTKDRVPGLAESVGYARGILAAMDPLQT